MKINLTLIGLLAVTIIISSCETPAPVPEELDMEAVRAEIQALEDAFAEASNAKDAESVVAYYAVDAQSMPPEAPTLKGKAAILEDLKSEMEADTTNTTVAFEIQDIWAADSIAVEVGKWIVTMEDGSTRTGKYISLFEKRDGAYICVRDIYNSDDDYDDEDDDDAGEDDD